MTFESVVKDVYCFRDINDIMVLMVFMEGPWKLEKLEVSATLEVETITNILSGQILARLNHGTMGKKCESNPEILKSWEEILKCWKSQWDQKKRHRWRTSFDLDWPQSIGSRLLESIQDGRFVVTGTMYWSISEKKPGSTKTELVGYSIYSKIVTYQPEKNTSLLKRSPQVHKSHNLCDDHYICPLKRKRHFYLKAISWINPPVAVVKVVKV